MDHKKRILAAIKHQPLDRFPTDIWATPEVWNNLRQHLGALENIQIYDQLEIDGIMEIAPPYVGPVLKQKDDKRVNEWGMSHQMMDYGSGSYEEQVYYPLAQAESVADLQDYPWPSPDWYDYSAIPGLAEQYPGRAILCGYFYHRNETAQRLARKFSLSDRIRYYWSSPQVQLALGILLQNLGRKKLPLMLISQYAPDQYERILSGQIAKAPEAVILDKINSVLAGYFFAQG